MAKSKIVSARIAPQVAAFLQKECRRRGVDPSTIIRALLIGFLEKHAPDELAKIADPESDQSAASDSEIVALVREGGELRIAGERVR